MSNILQSLQTLLQSRQYNKLISLIKANRQLLKSPEVCHMYGFALRQSGAIREALTFYNKTVKQFPKHPGILVGAANLFASDGKSERAITFLKKAIDAAPMAYDPVFNLARVYMTQSRFNDAMRLYKKAVQIKPDSFQAFVGLGSCYMNVNALDDAKFAYENALKLSPSYLPALNNLAGVYRDLGDIDQSMMLYQKAISLAPESSEIRRNCAALYALKEDIDNARSQYQLAIQYDPANVELHLEVAKFNWMHDDPEPFRLFEQAIESLPNKPELRIAYIQLLLRKDDGEGAYKALGNLLNDYPEDESVLAVASAAERQRNNLDSALNYSQRLYERKNKLADQNALNEHGYNSLATGDSKTALSIYRHLVKIFPENQGNWTLLSTALRESGKANELANLLCYESTIAAFQDSDESRAGRLKKDLLHFHNTSQHPIDQSLRNGTQTLDNIFVSPSDELLSLQNYIADHTHKYLETLSKKKGHPFLQNIGKEFFFNNAWSVNLHSQGFHKSHFHPQGWLSGVYYIEVPDSVDTDGQGWITFGKAEIPNLEHIFDYAVKPQKGLLVLFPSFMWHGTRPFLTDSNRMTVVVDILPKP